MSNRKPNSPAKPLRTGAVRVQLYSRGVWDMNENDSSTLLTSARRHYHRPPSPSPGAAVSSGLLSSSLSTPAKHGLRWLSGASPPGRVQSSMPPAWLKTHTQRERHHLAGANGS